MDTTLLLKATAVLLVALFAGRLLRNAPAAMRHRYWSVAFAALLLLPILALMLPALVVPMPQRESVPVKTSYAWNAAVPAAEVAASPPPRVGRRDAARSAGEDAGVPRVKIAP